MTHTKENVCLFIKDEKHLEEMREFLEGKGEIISPSYFYLCNDNKHNYLQYWNKDYKWFVNKNNTKTEVTTEQFKNLWE